MAFAFKPLTEDLVPAVKRFNSRLAATGVSAEARLPEQPTSEWLPKLGNRRIYEEHFLLVEGDVVRGGYIFKHQDFSFHGEVRSIGALRWPISEGAINKAYAWVGMQMYRNALRVQPMLYSLGMGGYDAGPLPRMLEVMGWSMCSVPFYFKVNRPGRFLREIQVLRNNATKRLIMDIAARTGVGWLGLTVLQSARPGRAGVFPGLKAEEFRGFPTWADDLWNECKTRYVMTAVRDSETLNILYPASKTRFLPCKVTRGGALLGWAVLLDTAMRNHKQFGNMRVGSIVDCLALPENASAVIGVATRMLEERGVDLIVSNQLHKSWCAALRQAGFLRGPSNSLFAASKELGRFVQPFHDKVREIHMNRGDGDGPVRL